MCKRTGKTGRTGRSGRSGRLFAKLIVGVATNWSVFPSRLSHLSRLSKLSRLSRLSHLSRLSRLTLLLVLSTTSAAAQETPDLEESRRRLEEIRAERDRLQRQRERLQGQVHDVNDELTNLERQRESTQRIVGEIERQIGGLASQLDRSSAELILAQDNLAERRAVLQRRLVDIYKRGPLHTFQVLLAAEGFGDLLSRYKYLYLTSEQDRALVSDVEQLRNRVVQQRNNILNVRGELDRRREEREAEFSKYSELAAERARKLQNLQRSARSTERRLTELQKDEARLNGLLASLERTRRDELARGALRGALGTGSITTADLGKLDWPVEGAIVYRFGRDTLPSGGIIRWNGVGIAAGVGTPVKAVESGKVRLVGQFGTYGLTIVVEHGNGYYSVYSHLKSADVKLGASVSKGSAIGTVGGQNSDYGPHLHFEIRGENQIALDPATWLRRR
jgi:septal ring factor EnvC (AmiA/AmiB activator)